MKLRRRELGGLWRNVLLRRKKAFPEPQTRNGNGNESIDLDAVLARSQSHFFTASERRGYAPWPATEFPAPPQGRIGTELSKNRGTAPRRQVHGSHLRLISHCSAAARNLSIVSNPWQLPSP